MPRAPSPDGSRHRGACPGCGAPASTAHLPFCSQGCRDRDLLQWLSDGYRLPVEDVEAEEGEVGTPALDSRAPPSL